MHTTGTKDLESKINYDLSPGNMNSTEPKISVGCEANDLQETSKFCCNFVQVPFKLQKNSMSDDTRSLNVTPVKASKAKDSAQCEYSKQLKKPAKQLRRPLRGLKLPVMVSNEEVDPVHVFDS